MRGGGDSFPQQLCDSYANRAPTRIPGNYCRTHLPTIAQACMRAAPAIWRGYFRGFPCRISTCTNRAATRIASF